MFSCTSWRSAIPGRTAAADPADTCWRQIASGGQNAASTHRKSPPAQSHSDLSKGGAAQRSGAAMLHCTFSCSSKAFSTARVRSRTPSLERMLETWFLIVPSATPQRIGDFLVGKAAGHQAQNLGLAVGQRVRPVEADELVTHVLQARQQALGHRRLHQRATVGDCADRPDQLLQRHILEQVATWHRPSAPPVPAGRRRR